MTGAQEDESGPQETPEGEAVIVFGSAPDEVESAAVARVLTGFEGPSGARYYLREDSAVEWRMPDGSTVVVSIADVQAIMLEARRQDAINRLASVPIEELERLLRPFYEG